MSAAGWEIQKAIYAALFADPLLQTLIGNPPRLYDAAPINAPFPFVVFGDARETKISGADTLLDHDIRLAIHSRYDGRREVKDIITAILSVLDDAPLTLTNYALISLRATFTDIFHRQESDVHQGLIRFRAVTEKV